MVMMMMVMMMALLFGLDGTFLQTVCVTAFTVWLCLCERSLENKRRCFTVAGWRLKGVTKVVFLAV